MKREKLFYDWKFYLIILLVLFVLFVLFVLYFDGSRGFDSHQDRRKFGDSVVLFEGEYYFLRDKYDDMFKDYIVNDTDIVPDKYVAEAVVLDGEFVIVVYEIGVRDYILYKGNKVEKYKDIDDLILFNDSFAFIGGSSRIVYFDKVLYTGSSLGSLVEVNGSLAYFGYEDGRRVVYLNGEVVSDDYFWANAPANVLGELAFYARDEDDNSFVVFRGDVYLDEFDETHFPFEFNNSIAYIGEKDNRQFVVVNRSIYCECEEFYMPCVSDEYEIIGC